MLIKALQFTYILIFLLKQYFEMKRTKEAEVESKQIKLAVDQTLNLILRKKLQRPLAAVTLHKTYAGYLYYLSKLIEIAFSNAVIQ